MVHCPKCKSVNSPDLEHCQKCNAKLLPGEDLATRIGALIVAALMTALGVFILYRMSLNNFEVTNSVCFITSPVFWGIWVISIPFMGLFYALRPTPRFQKFVNRAERHKELDPNQALSDFNQALNLAPEKERAGILKKRAAFYQKLGQQKEAVLDQLAYTQEEEAYKDSSHVVELLGADGSVYANSRRKDEQKALLQTGLAVGVGYCNRCKKAVPLDDSLRCKQHPRSKGQNVQFGTQEDLPSVAVQVENSHLVAARKVRNSRIFTLVALFLSCVIIGYLLRDKTSKPTVLSVPTDAPVQAVIFSEAGFEFEYPSDWEIITQADQNRLLSGSLAGLENYDYLGGVYYKGLDNCSGCAQIILVVMNDPSLEGNLTQEQFQATRNATQERLGERLIAYNYVTLDGLPAAESQYYGKSGKSQQWSFIAVPTLPEMAYSLSMSAEKSSYETFKPVFEQVVSTIKLPGEGQVVEIAATPAITQSNSAPTATASDLNAPAGSVQLEAKVLRDSINLRAGPGTQYETIGSLAKGEKVIIDGRNSKGDWLCFHGPDGSQAWVFAPLMALNTSRIQELPVEAD